MPPQEKDGFAQLPQVIIFGCLPLEFVPIVSHGRTFVNEANTTIFHMYSFCFLCRVYKSSIFPCKENDSVPKRFLPLSKRGEAFGYSASSTALHSLSTVERMGMQVAAP